MEKYYLHDGFNQSGPFTIEEIQFKSLSGDTPVWHQGLEEWTFVDQVPELMKLINTPPPFKNAPPVIAPVRTTPQINPGSLPALKKRRFTISVAVAAVLIAGWLIVEAVM